MSAPGLSRQDVESWLPETIPATSKAPGFVAKFFTTLKGALSTIAISSGDQRYRNELERFFLWGHGLSVIEGELDEVLAHSKELHVQVLLLLQYLGTAVRCVILQDMLPKSESTQSKAAEQCDDLQALIETTDTQLQESGADSDSAAADSGGSEYGADDILDEITTYIECLLDLAPSLDNPALDEHAETSGELLNRVTETFTTSCEEALIYCRRVRDRFESLPKYLVERLAEANAIRAARLRSLRVQSSKADLNLPDDFTESLFSGTHPRMTETTRSTVPSSSMFSLHRLPQIRRSTAQFSDSTSEATFASFSTTQSTVSQGRPRVPHMPAAEGSDGFTCSVCYKHIAMTLSKKEWRLVIIQVFFSAAWMR